MKNVVYIVTFLLLYHPIYAQNTSQNELKIGLVLSGGGAKGYAHIGVLKAIDEIGLKIDYIGGTSMGAIVGSLYAAGYTGKEIENIVQTFGFDTYMDDEVSRSIKPFYLKEMDDKYRVKLPIYKNRLQLPSGFSNGQNLMNQYSKYTQHVSHIHHFNELPIPFLCIATNLENGSQVVLTQGDLSEAVRASAAYPTVVRPIEIDGKLLADGGIVNNFPVTEVRNMGANFIIGVEVASHDLYTKDDLFSAVNIMEQLVSYQMMNDSLIKKSNLTDMYFRPVQDDYTTFSFDKAREIVDLGYRTAMKKIDSLTVLASQHATIPAEKRRNVVLNHFAVDQIIVNGNQQYTYDYIIEKLQIRIGKIISFDNLSDGINRLWSTDNFTQITHKVVLDNGLGTIILDLQESPVKQFVKIGGHYDERFGAGVLVNYTHKQLLFGTDYFSADAVVGENFRYNLNYFVDNGIHLSVGLQSVFQNFDFTTHFSDGNTTFQPEVNNRSLTFSHFNNRLYFQYVYQDNFALGFGAEHHYLKSGFVNNTDPTIPNLVNASFYDLFSYLKYDTFDHKMFPKKGLTFDAIGKWYVHSTDNTNPFQPFLQGKLAFGYAFPIYTKCHSLIQSEAGMSFAQNENPFLDFHIGGTPDNYLYNYSSFYGLPNMAIGNNSYLKTALTVNVEWQKNHFLGVTTNIARAERNVLQNLKLTDNIYTGWSLHYGIKSLVGPIEVSYAHSPQADTGYWSVKYGFWF